MLKKTGWLSAGLTLAAFSAVASFALGGVGSAQAAVVYCKTVGVPKGCVVRPTPVRQRWSLHRSSALPVSASARPASVFVPARR
jgi:hypothetical protein